MTFTQENRVLSITTPLGKDALLLTSIQGTEGISRLFSFDLTMISENHGISFTDIIGKNVTVNLFLASGKRRYFNGLISRFVQGASGGATGIDPRFSHYRATLVPWTWLLTRTADCRIFSKLSVPDIVEKVFRDNGFSDFKLKLQGNYEKREYTVQHRETDFSFISRLLEAEGISYFFEHGDGKHTMIILDSPQAFLQCPEQKTARYEIDAGAKRDEDTITELEKMQEIRSGKYSLNDFNFETPNTSLAAEVLSKVKLGPGNREIYDYPGLYSKKAEGERSARIRIEEEEARVTTISGSSRCRAFTAGYRFVLDSFYRKDMNGKDFVLTLVEHTAQQGWHETGKFSYENRFTCIPADIPFRPPRITAKPFVQGNQTAIVVGPPDEEIYPDKYGRVKVQFHWDREGKKNQDSSCWIRVSQGVAGAGWGAMFIPRVGQEVIVDFLEGDPDRPIITGRVYHGMNMPPYNLPAEKTRSTIKSNSTPGGGGYNEIRIEDKKGSEQIFIHAEKQLDVRIKKDALEWVGNERHLIVTKDQLEKVTGDKHLEVTGDQREKIGGTVSQQTGRNLQQKVGAKHALDAGQEIHLNAGMNVVIEAGTQISLKVGGNYIDISPVGVFIKGNVVLINSGGSAGSGSGASPDLPKAPKEAEKG